MGECLDGGELIVAQRYKRGRSGVCDSLGKCAGSRGGGACGSAGWDGAIMRGKLHSFGNVFCTGMWNVDVVTLVVVRSRSEVPPIDTVGGSVAAVVGCLVDNDSGAGRCQGCAVEVKCPVQLGFRQKSWIEAGRTDEVECEGSMGDEAVPEMQGEVGVADTEAENEVILVGLDFVFCAIPT